MKAAQSSTVEMLHRLESIEKEVLDLKLSVLKTLAPSAKKIVSLRGILKGVDVTDSDIKASKDSLYSKTKI